MKVQGSERQVFQQSHSKQDSKRPLHHGGSQYIVLTKRSRQRLVLKTRDF